MTGDDRAVERRRRIPLLTVACLSGSLLVAGCADLRQIVGMDQGGPDEFAVETRAPLTIPPDFNLRPPQPGAPRPQEVTATERAEQVINTAGPGKPGDQAQMALQVPKGGVFPGERPNPDREVTPDSLASRLLSANDTTAVGTPQRETTPLKGIY
jgi:Protein of unknown function (DUF3035)